MAVRKGDPQEQRCEDRNKHGLLKKCCKGARQEALLDRRMEPAPEGPPPLGAQVWPCVGVTRHEHDTSAKALDTQL